MKQVVVMGHGGYAEGVRRNLEMIAGEADHMHFLDLMQGEDLSSLEGKVDQLIEELQGEGILFTCDLMGASPFRVAAMRCAKNPGKYITVTGLNTMAYIELNMNSDLSIEKLADRAMETTKKSVEIFPK
jgi:PTS system N-acetylgalactosamine-specific IIA component